MAGRSPYTDEDRSRIFVVLAANDQNVKRTARETGVPENTVRRWKKEFEKDPPKVENIEAAVGDFVGDADRVRHKALRLIEKKIDGGDAKVNELNNTVGILTDKIDRARGLVDRRVVEHKLPSADEIRAALGAFAQEAQALATQRQADIEITDVVEQPALPAGK